MMKTYRRILLSLSITFSCAATVCAVSPRQEILNNRNLAASNLQVYPVPEKPDTVKAPAGYAPFYLNSYARHGSRYLCGQDEYDRPILPVQKAEAAGVLTPQGKRVAAIMDKFQKMSRGRIGELTPVGAAQHRGIAHRLYRNFPEIFKDSTHITARSTNVIRCIMSMMAECLALQQDNPMLQIDHDASEYDMPRLNDWPAVNAAAARFPGVRDSLIRSQLNRLNPDRFLSTIFADPEWVKANIADPKQYMWDVFFLATNWQSHGDRSLDFTDIFTPEECYDLWRVSNAMWYAQAGNSPLTGNGAIPMGQALLYADLLDVGDCAAAERKNGATMRFGHESVVLPTTVFFDVNGAGYSTADIDSLCENWANYRYIPMACNLQFVLYKDNNGGDILARVLLNEHDVTLPVKPVEGVFYRWSDLSDYYHKKLATAPR